MEDHLHSSETFAKALKGFQISPAEKIRLAQEAWRRTDVVLPHKQEFLLEWLCNALLKSATPGKGSKDSSPNVVLDLDYWELFRDMLTGIAHGRKTHPHIGAGNTLIDRRHNANLHGVAGGNITESQAPGVLLRIPVVPIFTSLVQKLLPSASSNASSSSELTSDTAIAGSKRKKSKAQAPVSVSKATSDTVQDNMPLPSLAVVESARSCLELLCGPSMSEWFQPTLEQYTPLVQATLEVLVGLNQIKTQSAALEKILLEFGAIVTDRFWRLVVVQPNQKKVFTLLAGPMFEALVGARFSTREVSPSPAGSACQEAIGNILKSGLFHQEHLQEYTSGYNTAGGEKSLQSYQKQLFDHISEMTRSDSSAAAVLDALPVMLSYFVEETRRKQRTLANSGFDRGIESARETEFDFFKIVYVLAQKQLPSLNENPSPQSLDQLADIMEALIRLLSTILDLNMYQPSNNEEADQYVFMSTSFGSMYACLNTAEKNANGRLQSISLRGIVVLSRLDDRLLKPHLDSLWPTLFSPLHMAQDSALELCTTLLEIYGKSSDLKTFLTSLLTSLRPYASWPEKLQSSPLFSRQFLDLIPSNIRSYLPLPQSPTILDIFVSELMTLDTDMDQLERLDVTTFSSQEEEPTKKMKKRKLNSGNSTSPAMEPSVPSYELITAFFIQFLKGIRVTTNQEKQLNKDFMTLYQHSLKQIFNQVAYPSSPKGDVGSRLSKIFQFRRLTPALQLHYALCKVSTKYWAHAMPMDLAMKMSSQFSESPHSLTIWTDAAILTMNRVILQHVHLTLCSSQTTTMEQPLTKQCQDLVRTTMRSSRLDSIVDKNSDNGCGLSALSIASWDGRLEHATGDHFLVASWQIQVNDWLDIVCRFGTEQDMDLIATVITGHFSQSGSDCTNRDDQDPFSTEITIHLLNQILLRSSNFYEVPNFRQIFAQKILQGLAHSIAALSQTDLEKKLAATIVLFTSAGTTEAPNASASKITYQDALKDLVEISKLQQDSRKRSALEPSEAKLPPSISNKQSHLLSLLSVMHLLPLEYFEKYERNIILTTMAVLDYLVPRYMSAKPSEMGLKCLLLERRISNSIMTWRVDAGVMCFDSQIMLNMLVSYPHCTMSIGRQDESGLGQATLQSTCLILDHVVRYMLGQLQQQPQMHHQLEALLADVFEPWVKDEDVILSSKWAVEDGRLQLSESRIKFALISQVCQSLVNGLEGLKHHWSKSRGKKSKELSDMSMDMDQDIVKSALSVLEIRIGDFFDSVQAKTMDRIRKVLAHNNKSSDSMGNTLKAALECMDHFELYRTLVLYGQLSPSAEIVDKKGKKGSKLSNKSTECLNSVEDLFRLAQVLAREVQIGLHHHHRHEDQRKHEGLEHLVAILTAYSCEYLPKSSGWHKQQESNSSTIVSFEKQLLELLTMISVQEQQRQLKRLVADDKDIMMLKDAYLALLGQLSEHQFEDLLHWLLEERVASTNSSIDALVLVRYLDATFLCAHHQQKRLVRRQISRLLSRSIRILQTTTSVEVVVAVLDLMSGICSESSFELRSWEVGLCLEGITSLMSPATPLLHHIVGESLTHNSAVDSNGQLTNKDTTRIFTSMYHVLINIVRFRQEELTSLIPVFMTILQGCLHGFKSLHGSIAKRQQGLESLFKSPFMLLSSGALTPATGPTVSRSNSSASVPLATKHHSTKSTTLATPAATLSMVGDPLSVTCAENFSRLLTALGSKGIVSHHQQHQQNQQQQQLEGEGSLVSGTPSGMTTVSADASKAFGKHAPYLLMEYFTIQSSVVASIRSLELRNALLPGLYGLLNLCSEWEREMMMVGLDSTGKTLLKGLYADYLKYHKYTGQ
ncbi:hypothetical protein BGZ83_009537 [Gryganskiella cystojenkinii]|nr:hypothetical protein BGZ83_009537 [Gryganskiella cystojenkinii]